MTRRDKKLRASVDNIIDCLIDSTNRVLKTLDHYKRNIDRARVLEKCAMALNVLYMLEDHVIDTLGQEAVTQIEKNLNECTRELTGISLGDAMGQDENAVIPKIIIVNKSFGFVVPKEFSDKENDEEE
jgi:hypothetical protein